jgi:hypothetical protein
MYQQICARLEILLTSLLQRIHYKQHNNWHLKLFYKQHNKHESLWKQLCDTLCFASEEHILGDLHT